MIPHTNFWWFRTQILKYLMIPYTNFGEWSRKFSIRFWYELDNDVTPTHLYQNISYSLYGSIYKEKNIANLPCCVNTFKIGRPHQRVINNLLGASHTLW